MDESEIQMRTALRVASDALDRYEADPDPKTFRIWRDASELAVKWYRQHRLSGGEGEESFEAGLAKVLGEQKS